MSNIYSDDFLSALGAWQRGWREQKDRRLPITHALLSAIEPIRAQLPVSEPLPACFRKRFLVPDNQQNSGDFLPLVLDGRVEEGVAAWTSHPEYHHDFKELVRPGTVTTLFRHTPDAGEVVADLNALWADPAFVRAVHDYDRRGGETPMHFFISETRRKS